ncbi:hypothetical protein QUF90_21140 [Desulfococcaceae bacterium HSG9]|nr:hypothetical protein [Desulfococcaceae bacterium HSG9]
MTQRDFFYDFRRLEKRSLIFELISVISFADNTESGGVSGVHDLLHTTGAVVERFDRSEIAPPRKKAILPVTLNTFL